MTETGLEELEVLILLREFRDGVEEKIVVGRLEKLNPLWVKKRAKITPGQAIKQLERRGFVERIGNWVRITPEGKAAIPRD